MIDFLKWILGNFWHFLGFVIILYVVLSLCIKGLVVLVALVMKRDVTLS